MTLPTKEQEIQMDIIAKKGYLWNKDLSTSYCAVVWSNGYDIWVFGLDGSIAHNPQDIIKINV